MNPLNWIRRINAELAAASERSKQVKYRKALRRKRVVMPEPRRDSRDWQGDFERMMRGKN